MTRALSRFVRDMRYARRRLRKTPVFTLFAIVTLALGIGATTAIYSVVHAVLSPPPGIANVERLVNVYHTPRGSIPMIALSWGDYQDLRARQTVFDKVTGWTFDRLAFAANGQTGAAFGEFVGGDYFDVLGVTMAAGRPLQLADDQPGAAPVVVISHGVWQRMFAASPDAVGSSLRMNGRTFQVVGVASREFSGLFNSGLVPTAMWAPLSTLAFAGSSRASRMDDRDNRWVLVKGRLAPGRTVPEAAAEVARIAKQLDADVPLGRDIDPRYRGRADTTRPWQVRPAADIAINESADFIVRPMAATVMVAVGLVLLVACTNLANLMLARGTDRRHELAVRLALGASRWQLLREAMTESVLIASAGGLLGIGVARALMVLLSNDLAVGNGATLRVLPRLDLVVIAMSIGATLLALAVAGLLPALQSTRGDLRPALDSNASHAGLPRWRARRFLIATQVTVSVMLVALAALCIFQVRAGRRIDRGMDLERLALAEVDFAGQQYEPERVAQIASAALRQLQARANVDAASVSSGLPLFVRNPGASVQPLTGSGSTRAALIAASPDVFRTLGVRLTRGRILDARDAAGAAPVIVISEITARALFASEDPLGKQVRFTRTRWVGDPDHPVLVKTIVGVVGDVGGSGAGESSAVYVPLEQQPEGHLVFAARTAGDPAKALPVLRQTLASIDPSLAVAQVVTGASLANTEMVFFRIMGGLAAVLGAFALVLALAGLFGILSHLVGRRTREIGVRIALGADRTRVVRMVLRDGLHPVVSGIVLGLILGAIARMSLGPMFERLAPAMDPVVLTVLPLAMIAAGTLACYIPARRASRIDPSVALRD